MQKKKGKIRNKRPGNLGSWTSRMSLLSSNHLQGQVLPLPVCWPKRKAELCYIQPWVVLILDKESAQIRHLPQRKGPLSHSLNRFPISSHFRGKECPSLRLLCSFFVWPANSFSIWGKKRPFFLSFLFHCQSALIIFSGLYGEWHFRPLELSLATEAEHSWRKHSIGSSDFKGYIILSSVHTCNSH